MQEWKLSESLDFMEILRTATFAFKEKWCTPSSQEGNPTLNREEKHCLLSSTRCQERLFSRHWTPDLRLRPPRWSSLRRSSVGLKHHWFIWGTMEPKTTKRDYCKTFYAKRESVMRLPKDTAFNPMDWPRDSTSPSWTRFRYMLIDANLIPKLWPHAAHDVVLIYNNLLHSALDNHKSPNDAYGDSSDFREFFVSYACKTWGFSRFTSRAPRKMIYCRPHSCKNASTSRAGTGRHSHKHPGQPGWALKDLPKRANLKLGWIQCEKSSQVWLITKLGPSSICLLEEKQYDVVGYIRLRKTNMELSIALKVAWWQKDIPRNKESTIMTLLHLLETKGFSDSSSPLPCILDTSFISWTSTLPIYMGTWKKPYTWSNQRDLMMDQAECVYLKSASMAWSSREENGTFGSHISWINWIRNLSQRTMLAG